MKFYPIESLLNPRKTDNEIVMHRSGGYFTVVSSSQEARALVEQLLVDSDDRLFPGSANDFASTVTDKTILFVTTDAGRDSDHIGLQVVEPEMLQNILQAATPLTFEPITLHEELIPREEWLEAITDGTFTDDDGHGYWATGTQKSNLQVKPSDITYDHKLPPEWATHVMWYNR